MITIIGSGLAGYTLVRELRKLDKTQRISVITQDNGDYYSKPQLSTALLHHKTPEQLVLIPHEKFSQQFDIDLVTQKIITPQDNLFSSQHQHKEQKIVFALGASPFNLRLNTENQTVYAVNNLIDYQQFREALEKNNNEGITIIGAGLVGCEFANDLILSGYKVNMIAPEHYPLAKLIPDCIGKELEKALSLKGVRFYLNQFFDVDKHQSLVDNHLILSAAGLKPNIALAQELGIETGTGIKVDSCLRTNQENIYALGDCAEIAGRVRPYVAPIALGARALAKTLLGEPTEVVYPPMPVFVKTSCYPVVSLMPETTESCELKIDIEKASNLGENINSVRVLYYNSHSELKGFALGGNFANEANEWTKNLSFP